MGKKRFGDAIRNVVEQAKRAEGKNIVVAKNIGGSGSSHSVSVRQRVVQRGTDVEIHEEREERRE